MVALSKEALWFGRFQPPSIAHLAMLETILKTWEKLTIAVIFNSPRPVGVDSKWAMYLSASDNTVYTPEKNPFAPQEIVAMWEACIQIHSLAERVTVIATPRPQYIDLNTQFPPEKFDYVLTEITKEDSAMDKLRDTIFPQLLGREVVYVKPPFKLHNSEIRRLVFSGEKDWQDFVPVGAYEAFIGMNGPARMSKR